MGDKIKNSIKNIMKTTVDVRINNEQKTLEINV